jgi:hypothetical protein
MATNGKSRSTHQAARPKRLGEPQPLATRPTRAQRQQTRQREMGRARAAAQAKRHHRRIA